MDGGGGSGWARRSERTVVVVAVCDVGRRCCEAELSLLFCGAPEARRGTRIGGCSGIDGFLGSDWLTELGDARRSEAQAASWRRMAVLLSPGSGETGRDRSREKYANKQARPAALWS